MASLSTEEKKQAIEEFIAAHQGKFITLKCASKQFKLCSPSTFESWIKSICGVAPANYLVSRGVILDVKDAIDVPGVRELWNELFDSLKAAYAGKAPADDPEQLAEDNPDIAVDDFWTISTRLNDPDFGHEKLMDCGILVDPWASDDAFKTEVANFIANKTKTYLSIRGICRDFPRPFSWKYGLNDSYIKLHFDRIPAIFGKTAEEYFISQKALHSHQKAEPICQKIFAGLVKEYAKKKDKPAGFWGLFPKHQTYQLQDLLDFYYDEAELKGFIGDDAEAYVKQLFVNADLLAGEKKELPEGSGTPAKAAKKEVPAAEKTEIPAAIETGSIEKRSFGIYEKLDTLDLTPLYNAAKTAAGVWPKGKKFKVSIGKTEFAVSTYFSKSQEKAEGIDYGRDAATELKNMKTREEVVAEILERDPNRRTDAADYATAAFRNSSPVLTDEQIKHRLDFIAAVAYLISDQKTMEAIAANAQKKKNGTLHKGRVQKIALSGIADGSNTVYAIVARNKTDTSISITFEDFTSKPGDLDEWNSDFISTYHADLPISEALAKVFG